MIICRVVMVKLLSPLLFILFCYTIFTSSVLAQAHDADLDDKLGDDMTVDEDEDQDQLPPVTSPKAGTEKLRFSAPTIPANAYYAMYFTAPSNLASHLVLSEMPKDSSDPGLFKYTGMWSVEVPETSAIEGDYGLVVKSKANHHAVSAKLNRPFVFENGKHFVVQYEVKFQNGMECGGAYIKLLTDNPTLNLKYFHDKTPYTIMFGPDKCGLDHKLHFIVRHKNLKTGEIEEKHAKKPKGELEKFFTDKKTHLYTLVVSPDNTFEIFIDQTLFHSGSLLEDFEPPFNPPKEIDDPEDKKPASWDERPKIVDASATKPADWDESAPEYIIDESAKKPANWLDDEPLTVPDPGAQKPSDWDEDMDGEWEAAKIDNPKCKTAAGCGAWEPPRIKNPAYKGKWHAPMIDNPDYKGIWKARRIANPDYYEDQEPYKMSTITAIGLELWTITENIVFDNFIITDNKRDADNWAAQTFDIKRIQERKVDPSSQSVVDAIREATQDKPWIWAVIILVISLPVILVIVYCCWRSPAAKKPVPSRLVADAGVRKKLDISTPDDSRTRGVRSDGDKQEENGEESEEEDEEDENEVHSSADEQQQRNEKTAQQHATASAVSGKSSLNKKTVARETASSDDDKHADKNEDSNGDEGKKSSAPATRRKNRKD